MTLSSELTERQAFLVLNAIPGVGPIVLNRLLEEFGGDPRLVLEANARRLESVKDVSPALGARLVQWRKHFDLKREEEHLARGSVDFMIRQDGIYPRLLREIHDPPIGLYRQGRYDFKATCIAIVGSRRTTLYGMGIAKRLAADLVRIGFCIVSGLARGIDTAAHESALSAGGKTVAVLGSGIDTVYPPENSDLSRRIAETGAVLSEFPFGRRPTQQSFPMRNRIVSGLCEATIVVESDVDGGAMITARLAGEQGRLVFAVPGRIDQPTSAGCHQLIRDGATLLTGVDDILSELSYLGGFRPLQIPKPVELKRRPERISALSADEQSLLACFSGGEILSPDGLAARSGLGAAILSSTLMMLELKQWIAKRLDGRYEATS